MIGVRFACALAALVTACGGGGAAPRVGGAAAPRAGAATALAGAAPATRLDTETGVARIVGGPETCFNARDDDGNGLIDEGCGLSTGLVQFVIAWTAPTADVDLLVTDPKGEVSDVGRPTSSGLVKERDCPGRRGECRGKNTENVYLEKEDAKRGTYKVSVRLERLEDEDLPIRVTLGARVGPKVYASELLFSSLEQRAELRFEL